MKNSLELLERYNQLFHIPPDVKLPSKYVSVSCLIGDEKFLANIVREACPLFFQEFSAQLLNNCISNDTTFVQNGNPGMPRPAVSLPISVSLNFFASAVA